MGFPGGSDSKESACNVRDLGSIPGLRRSPGGGHGNPLQYSCLENLHGRKRLVDYSPRDCKESDMTEKLSTHSTLDLYLSIFLKGLPRLLSGKDSACQRRRHQRYGLIPGSGRSSGGGNGNPPQYSCLENPHEQRSLKGYSP